ncbi:MAG: 50S ribosomal protein L25 [Microthrixaceae bacterium]
MSQQDETIAIEVQVGRETGSGAAIRERAEGRIPGILYGLGLDPTPISVERASLRHALSTERGQNALLTVTAGDETTPAIVKDLQRHPVRRSVTHFDLQRVAADQQITVVVPVYLVGTAKEVAAQGGMVERKLSNIKVRVRADSIPERIEADISGLSVGRSLQVKDLTLDDGIKVLTDGLKSVASAELTRAAVVAQNVVEADGAEGDAEGEAAEESA